MQSVFLEYRHTPWLIERIGQLQEVERSSVSHALPSIVGDYYLGKRQFVDAVELFLHGNDNEAAAKATESAIDEARHGQGDIVRIVELWKQSQAVAKTKEAAKSNAEKNVEELLALFNSPQEAASTKTVAAQALERFGRHTVRLAVQQSSASDDLLHSFDRTIFKKEIRDALVKQHAATPINVLHFYVKRDDRDNAAEFATDRLQSWADDDLLHIFDNMLIRSNSIVDELQRRGILPPKTQEQTTLAIGDRVRVVGLKNKQIGVSVARDDNIVIAGAWNSRVPVSLT